MQHKLVKQDDFAELAAHLETMFDMCRKNWGFVELAMTYRHQKSDFGRVLAKAWHAMEQDVVDHFADVFKRLEIKVEASHLHRIALSVHALIMRVGERERTRSASDRRAAAEQVAAMIAAIGESVA